MSPSERHTFFATCAPGIEPLLHAEVRELRLAKHERQVGGVRFEGTLGDAWRANLELRTAVRVLCRLSRFQARDADELYRGVSHVPWSRWMTPDGTLWVDAQTKESALSHSRFVAQRTKDAVVDQLRALTGARPDVDRERPSLRLHVHVHRDRVTLSLDTSGDSLHKRGWRRAQGRAPLAETLAAALVLRSGWDRRSPLLDPFCGSGTILVEAGLLATATPPGLFRADFGFESLPGHDGPAFAALKRELAERRVRPRKVRLLGSDVSPERIDEARANVAAAGLEELVRLEVADARTLTTKPGWNGWIVTNPPYGQRLAAAADLYRDFGRRLRERCDGYTLSLLTADDALVRALELDELSRTRTQNGGLDCTIVSGRLEGLPHPGNRSTS